MLRNTFMGARSSALFASTLAGVFLSSAPVSAETWRVNPQFSIGTGYTDTVRLTNDSDSAISVLGYGKVTVSRHSERSRLNFDAGFSFNRYETDDTFLNEDERPFFGVGASYDLTERTRFKLRSSYVEDLISGESPIDVDSDEISQDNDTGFTREQLIRETITFQPTIETRLNERLSLEGVYKLQERSYDRFIGIQDSSNHDGRVTLSLTMNPKIDWLVQARGLYSDTSLDQEVTGYTASVGLRQKYSEVGKLTYFVGWSDMDFESNINPAAPQKFSDSVLSASVQWDVQGETTNVQSILGRTQSPSASGGFVVSNYLSVTGRWRLSEKLEGSLYGRIFRNESVVSGFDVNDDRDYLTIVPTFSYLLTEKWKISLRYKYTRSKRETDGSAFDQNQVSLGIKYTPLREF